MSSPAGASPGCPTCGFPLRPQDEFCGRCGRPRAGGGRAVPPTEGPPRQSPGSPLVLAGCLGATTLVILGGIFFLALSLGLAWYWTRQAGNGAAPRPAPPVSPVSQASPPAPPARGPQSPGPRPRQPAPQQAQGDNYLVIPGRRVGPLWLGRPVSRRALEFLGPPSRKKAARPGAHNKGTGEMAWQSRGIQVGLNDGVSDTNVYWILCGNPQFRTDRGIAVGSTSVAVKKAYPSGQLVKLQPGTHAWAVRGGIYVGIVKDRAAWMLVAPRQ